MILASVFPFGISDIDVKMCYTKLNGDFPTHIISENSAAVSFHRRL